MNKKGIEFSFTWMFAIIVGAVILFIAVFAAVRLVDTSRVESDAKVAEQLGILLNPIETNLEDVRYAVIQFPDETQIINRCRETGNFGRQIISARVRSGIGDEFQREGTENFFFNKYLFSDEIEQGRELFVLTKPFEMPYKIADIFLAYTEEYCFVNPPNEIEEEITSLGAEQINISSSSGNCPAGSVRVCFSGDSGCNVNVNLISKTVTKGNDFVVYEGALIYGAIFAEPEIYECQVKRLMKRNAELAHLYAEKTEFLSGKGCSSNLANDLRDYGSLAGQINNSANLGLLANQAETLRRRNENLICKAF